MQTFNFLFHQISRAKQIDLKAQGRDYQRTHDSKALYKRNILEEYNCEGMGKTQVITLLNL